MSAKEIREKVIELADEASYRDAPVTEDSRLELDLGLWWLDKLELVMDIEEALGIELHDEIVDELKTVGDLVKAAQRTVQRQAEQEAV